MDWIYWDREDGLVILGQITYNGIMCVHLTEISVVSAAVLLCVVM